MFFVTIKVNTIFFLFPAVIADMSLHILEKMSEFKVKHLPKEEVMVRIGIHTGPCCAGKRGTRRFCSLTCICSLMKAISVLVCLSADMVHYGTVGPPGRPSGNI